MHTGTYIVKGMHCASCAGIIESTLKKEEGVFSADVNAGTEMLKLSFDEKTTTLKRISESIEPYGYSIVDEVVSRNKNSHKDEKFLELRILKRKLLSAFPLAIISIFFMGWDVAHQFSLVAAIPDIILSISLYVFPLFAAFILFFVGQQYLLGVYRFLRHGKANMDTLIGIGTLTAFIYSASISIFGGVLKDFLNTNHTYYDVTIVVITFIILGKYLEMKSKLRTGDAIEKLFTMQAKTALVIREGLEKEIPVEQVVCGDLIIVKPAGKIPVDGIVTEGFSYVDEAMITGEPIPTEKNIGDSVVAGTINTNGSFTFKVTKVGSETMLAYIIKMVEEAQGSKAPIQALADKISGVFVPIVLVIAFLTFGAWLFIGTQHLGFSQAVSFGLTSFVGVLVIACPCALGLATPTAIIVGVGKGAREGILIKDAATLEKLHKVSVVVMDKTGTVTRGKPELVSFQNHSQKSDDAFISLLASLEKKSEHPIASAIVSYADKRKMTFHTVDNFKSIKGKGLQGTIGGIDYFAGNAKLVMDIGLTFDAQLIKDETLRGKTPIILATKEGILGVVLVADVIKDEASEAIAHLHKLGIRVVMLTGDDKNTAQHIADRVGIDDVIAEVLPEDKLRIIKEFQSNNTVVAMVGDGVNDAPALAQADVGIAMATGTDVAIESAGITLLRGDVSKLVKAITLSKITMRGIKQNLFWAFVYNVIGIPLASGLFYPFFGWLLNPIFAGFAMAFSSVSVVSNSLRIKMKKI